MISKKGRFIFFHIPRTGGTAVQDCLWGGRTNTQAGSHPRDNLDYYRPYDWHLYGFKDYPNIEHRPAETIEYEGEVVGTFKAHPPQARDVVEHVGQGIYDWNISFLAEDSTLIR